MKKLTTLLALVLFGLIVVSQVTVKKELNYKGKANSNLYFDITSVTINFEENKICIDAYTYFDKNKKGEIGQFNFVVDSIGIELKDIIIAKLEAELKKEYDLRDNEIEKEITGKGK